MKISFIAFLLLLFPQLLCAKDSGELSFKAVFTHDSNRHVVLPLQQLLLPNMSQLTLLLNNKKVNFNYEVLALWPLNKQKHYLRTLLLEIEDFPSKNSEFTLKWEKSKTALISKTLQASYNPDNVLIALKDSLTNVVLLHKHGVENNSIWYTAPQSLYASYITNDKALQAKGYPRHKVSQWLFDRPQALYQLYMMTGEERWLKDANKFAEFYTKNIDFNGDFSLRKKYDPKYFMPKGLLFKYLLSGDKSAKAALKRSFKASLKWDPEYNFERGFWTERNQAAAFNTAVSYWEASNDEKALQRINQILDATVQMTFKPVNGWPLRGCPQHTFRSHEGKGDNTATCSPWMMALLSDALWRFYQLTGDVRAEALIDAFGDFVLDYGIFWGDEKVNNIVIPKYIVSMDNSRQEELNQWSDPQHMCDVAAMLGKSVYVKKLRGKENLVLTELFGVFTEQCSAPYKKFKALKEIPEYWLVQPPRRFGWTYSTSSDLPWLYSYLLPNKVNLN